MFHPRTNKPNRIYSPIGLNEGANKTHGADAHMVTGAKAYPHHEFYSVPGAKAYRLIQKSDDTESLCLSVVASDGDASPTRCHPSHPNKNRPVTQVHHKWPRNTCTLGEMLGPSVFTLFTIPPRYVRQPVTIANLRVGVVVQMRALFPLSTLSPLARNIAPWLYLSDVVCGHRCSYMSSLRSP